MDIQNDRLFTRKEFLELLQISEPTFKKYRRREEIPDPVILVGQEYWPASLINRWIVEANPHLSTSELEAAAASAIVAADSSH